MFPETAPALVNTETIFKKIYLRKLIACLAKSTKLCTLAINSSVSKSSRLIIGFFACSFFCGWFEKEVVGIVETGSGKIIGIPFEPYRTRGLSGQELVS